MRLKMADCFEKTYSNFVLCYLSFQILSVPRKKKRLAMPYYHDFVIDSATIYGNRPITIVPLCWVPKGWQANYLICRISFWKAGTH